jgi:UDP-glucose 4-epimerase
MVKTIEDTLNLQAKLEIQPMQQGDVNTTYANIQKDQKLIGYDISK